jgi:hypothetical protein
MLREAACWASDRMPLHCSWHRPWSQRQTDRLDRQTDSYQQQSRSNQFDLVGGGGALTGKVIRRRSSWSHWVGSTVVGLATNGPATRRGYLKRGGHPYRRSRHPNASSTAGRLQGCPGQVASATMEGLQNNCMKKPRHARSTIGSMHIRNKGPERATGWSTGTSRRRQGPWR